MGDTKQSRWKRAAWLIALVLVLWAAAAYLLMPALWRRSTSRHPALDELPKITHTANGIPGDPLNLALIGTEAGLHNSLLDAGWRAADPLTWRTSLKIARTTVLRQSYDDAPVSHLYLWGRQEDSAFEKPVGHDPRKRHHVRFWRLPKPDAQGRLFSFSGTGSGGPQLTPPAGQDVLTSSDIRDCAAQVTPASGTGS